jgi:hypothetical protein
MQMARENESGTRHTRGPWIVLPEEPGVPYIRVRGDRLGTRFKIANVLSLTFEDVHDAAETRANAYLIAAAPDLLGLLTEARSAIGDRLLTDVFGYEWVENLRTALSKVAGESA